jgi:hypothetical protein
MSTRVYFMEERKPSAKWKRYLGRLGDGNSAIVGKERADLTIPKD